MHHEARNSKPAANQEQELKASTNLKRLPWMWKSMVVRAKLPATN
jgi:hypothetical protein